VIDMAILHEHTVFPARVHFRETPRGLFLFNNDNGAYFSKVTYKEKSREDFAALEVSRGATAIFEPEEVSSVSLERGARRDDFAVDRLHKRHPCRVTGEMK
jgi:hypothetical protein